MNLFKASLIFLSLLAICEFSKIESEITLSLSLSCIPFIPLDDLPLNNLNFLDLNLIHLPNLLLKRMPWSSLQILTPIILSPLVGALLNL